MIWYKRKSGFYYSEGDFYRISKIDNTHWQISVYNPFNQSFELRFRPFPSLSLAKLAATADYLSLSVYCELQNYSNCGGKKK